MSFKVIIAGSRTFDNYELLKEKCNTLLSKRADIEIVSGAARGADKLGEQYANEHGYKLTHFHADWDTYGKGAGFKRNNQMALYADALIAFWDGKSRGTEMMIQLARGRNLLVRVVKY